MRSAAVVVIACLFASSGGLAAQSWKEAYARGDYQKAADLLHPVVVEQALNQDADDPTAIRQLAEMYAAGRGVRFDPIAACELALMSQTAASRASHRLLPDLRAYDRSLLDDARLLAARCDGLAERDRIAAHRSAGCFAFGMPEMTLMLDEELVWIGRGGVRLAQEVDEKIDGFVNCPQIVARVRALSLHPPPNKVQGIAGRHFVELLAWRARDKKGSSLAYVLNLQLYELQHHTFHLVQLHELGSSLVWPDPVLPREIEDGLVFAMTESGAVRWQLTGASPRSGEVPFPDHK